MRRNSENRSHATLLVPRHGAAEVRRELERLSFNEPAPQRLTSAWMCVPKHSSLDDVAPGTDVALRLADGSVLVGAYVVETANRIRFRPWGAGELVLPKSAITGASLLGPHKWIERQAVAKRQASAARAEALPTDPDAHVEAGA